MPNSPTPGLPRTVPARPDRPAGAPASDGPTPHLPVTVPTPPAEGGDTVSTPAPPGPPAPRERRHTRYLIGAEVARGGMAVVYRGYDTQLAREVAVKVTLPGQDVRRFAVEARVTARLPHPGIPPVYSLGALRGGRMCLAMKFVDGRTLADELKAADRVDDRPRLVGVFERICETVGFAHSRGVVHRDLKPSNVMVGDFGEVYVMDWGLAKVRGGRKATAGGGPPAVGGGAADETRAGVVQGTPAYMAPEQARGEVVDARADVFALGGILAAILTGRAPFGGTSELDAVLQAAQAELNGCFARLDDCGADPELIAVAKRCLSAEAADRPADGSAVAAAVSEYREGVEARLRAAERERAAAEAKAAEEANTRREAEAREREQRKRRRAQLALAAAVLLLVTGGAGFAAWREHQKGEQARVEGERGAEKARADAEAGFKAQQARQGIDGNLKQSVELRKQYKFELAREALAQAAELAKGGAPERVDEVRQAQRDLALVEGLDGIRYGKWKAGPADGSGDFSLHIASPRYRAALAAYGLALDALDPADAARQIAASVVRAELLAAVDDWSVYEPNPAVRERLLDVARRADPDPWRDCFRTLSVRADRGRMAALVATAPPDLRPSVLVALAELAQRRGVAATPVLGAARFANPSAFELAFFQGLLSTHWGRDEWSGVGAVAGWSRTGISALTAAAALRPDNPTVWHNLGGMLYHSGDLTGAIAAYRRAVALDGGDAHNYYNLALALDRAGDAHGARAAVRRSVALDGRYAPSQNSLGLALEAERDPTGAFAAYRRAIALSPQYAPAHVNLGNLLRTRGDAVGAVEACRLAVAFRPGLAAAHYNLGQALYDSGDVAGAEAAHRRAIAADAGYAPAHFGLGVVLSKRGRAGEAIAAYQGAIEINPKYAEAYNNLGGVYRDQERYADAVGCARAAIKIAPRFPNAYAVLGSALEKAGDLVGARAALTEAARLDKKWEPRLAVLPLAPKAPLPREVGLDRADPAALLAYGATLRANAEYARAAAVCREAIALDPADPDAHNGLGLALDARGDYAAAERCYREAVQLDPTFASGHFNLSVMLRMQGKHPEAVKAALEAFRLDPSTKFRANAQVTLGQALEAAGKPSAARAALAEAARLHPKQYGYLKPPELAPPPREQK